MHANRRGGVRYRCAHASRLSGQFVGPVAVRRLNCREASFCWLEAHCINCSIYPFRRHIEAYSDVGCPVYLATRGSQGP